MRPKNNGAPSNPDRLLITFFRNSRSAWLKYLSPTPSPSAAPLVSISVASSRMPTSRERQSSMKARSLRISGSATS